MTKGDGSLVVQLRRWRRLAKGFALLLSLSLGLLFYTVPRALHLDQVAGELSETERALREIDSKMADVDRVLLRLRLYDAQLKSLSDAQGPHGLIPDEVFSNFKLLKQPSTEPLGDPMEPRWPQSADLRPSETWAVAVQARVNSFLALADGEESDLNEMVERLESIRALRLALPSRWPTRGKLTSGFGWRRSPIGRSNWRFHSGVDIAARRGTLIQAPASGRVIRAAWTGGYGRYIEIEHGFGVVTTYGHCDRIMVQKGDEVHLGDVLGTVGSTGRSTGPHLHFEVRLDDHPVDPLDYLGH